MKSYTFSYHFFKASMLLPFVVTIIAFSSCTENYSNGERVGFVVKFSRKGLAWKTYEGELNLTQTGMNTSSNYAFSIDRENEQREVVAKIDSAANLGWKVKLTYHETFGKNWFSHRGETDHFVTDVVVLDRNPASLSGDDKQVPIPVQSNGRVVDTIYLVIYKDR